MTAPEETPLEAAARAVVDEAEEQLGRPLKDCGSIAVGISIKRLDVLAAALEKMDNPE